MARKLNKYTFLGAVSLGSFFAGSIFEKYYGKCNQDYSLPVSSDFPRFSIFGSVLAATPLSPAPVQQSPTSASRVSQIMKYGFPSLDNIRSFDDYVLSYDRRNRVAHWVFEHLTHEHVVHNDKVDRSKCDFKPDESIHPFFRSDNSDYRGSGFDRGHLAAAGNHKANQKHVEQTFYLSNMAPQVGRGFNRDSWNRLERYVRKLTRNYPNVYVCTGPLYLPRKESDGKTYIKYQVIGSNNVAVPTHFFKVVVVESSSGELELEAYVMPNQVIDDATPLTSFLVPPESIERAAGLLFFDNVSRNKFSKINGKKN
ncbi:endonuclease G, mitochondrial [Agrilus planipennis]|uniref:Endonuclease n=1 Tax=Agrilus planipennis TaxID=224129 RepID=A0A1W4X8B8_AGRPL|nr:endonuclease G, mitochondrial [Agrilus planipennis]